MFGAFLKTNILYYIEHTLSHYWFYGGWSGGAMVLVNFQCRGVLLIWIRVGQGPTALAVGVGGCCLDIFSLVYQFFSSSLSLGDGPI